MRVPSTVMPGCDPVSFHGVSGIGVAVLHGFTGNPSSVRGVAEAMINAGFDVEMPRLPGHGTVVRDMFDTGWGDWFDETMRAVEALRDRADHVVLVGQSMGGTLALAAALTVPGVAGLVCINPVTRGRDEATMAMIDELVDDGVEIAPGSGSDIADPASSDIAYDGTPLRPVRSLVNDGITPITDRFGELTMPLRLFTSRQDHVVDPGDSEYLAASYGGSVDHVWLERSFHVATLDYDRSIVVDGSVSFVRSVVS